MKNTANNSFMLRVESINSKNSLSKQNGAKVEARVLQNKAIISPPLNNKMIALKATNVGFDDLEHNQQEAIESSNEVDDEEYDEFESPKKSNQSHMSSRLRESQNLPKFKQNPKYEYKSPITQVVILNDDEKKLFEEMDGYNYRKSNVRLAFDYGF